MPGQSPNSAVRQALVDRVVESVQAIEDEGVKKLAQGGFNVPGVV
jgi:hypothetical protein